jgi:hypothetical protein
MIFARKTLSNSQSDSSGNSKDHFVRSVWSIPFSQILLIGAIWTGLLKSEGMTNAGGGGGYIIFLGTPFVFFITYE